MDFTGWISDEAKTLIFNWSQTLQSLNALIQLQKLSIYLYISSNMSRRVGEASKLALIPRQTKAKENAFLHA